MTINKCVFNNIDLKNGYLISNKIYTNEFTPPTKIYDCTFKNCKTHNFKGVFNEYSEYTTIFGNRKKVRVISTQDCKTFND